MVLTYKCPGCGAAMVYKENSDSMTCPYCGRTETVSDMEGKYKDEEAKYSSEEEAPQFTEEETVAEDAYADDGEMMLQAYHCESCGATLMMDDVTVASFCSFCGNATLISDRVMGQKRPSRVIPFALDKEKATERFKEWTKKGLLTPSAFRSQTFIEKITGIYVPFWLYDYKTNVDYSAEGRISHSRISGDYRITTTDHYDVYRKIHAEYKMVPADASKNMDDYVMDCLEPFHYEGLKPFQMPYLSGFYAEKNTYDAPEMKPRVEKRVKEFGLTQVRNEVKGYMTVIPKNQRIQMHLDKAEYVMFPVWMVNYTYNGKKYTFALNGQTGKMVGNLPVSIGKTLALFFASTVIVFILFVLIGGVPW